MTRLGGLSLGVVSNKDLPEGQGCVLNWFGKLRNLVVGLGLVASPWDLFSDRGLPYGQWCDPNWFGKLRDLLV